MEDVRNVPTRLEDAAQLFRQRNASYGGNYQFMGAVMDAMYPTGLHVHGAEQWTRLMLQVHRVTKETRYSQNFHRGGHQDSMDDMAVYAQMAAETDEMASRLGPVAPSTKTPLFDLSPTDQIEKYLHDSGGTVAVGHHQWWAGRLYKKTVVADGEVMWVEAKVETEEDGYLPRKT